MSLILPQDIGQNLLIRRFLKGVLKLRPPKPKYSVTWDPSLVLSYLKNLPSNTDLSLLTLSKKMAMLLALSTGQRIQTLSLIRIKNVIFQVSGLKIFITDPVKTTGLHSTQPCIELPYFTEEKLCVVSTMLTYIEKTASVRPADEEFLFLSCTKPYKRASTNTIGRWLMDVMNKSGINTNLFSAYSTRHASTSAASRAGVSWDVIRKNAGWTEKSQMFARFYNRPLIPLKSDFMTLVFKEN